MASGAPFLREENGQAIVAWERIDILIPEAYFNGDVCATTGMTTAIAEDTGGALETLCLFDVRARETENSKERMFAVRLPARLRLEYGESSTEGAGEDAVRVFTARAGAIFCRNLSVIQSSANVSEIFRAMAGARLTGVAYEDIATLFADGTRINGASTGVTRALLESIVSEMARCRANPNMPFRVGLANGTAVSDDDFIMMKLKELPRLNSVFAGIGFENIQLAVQSGVRKSMTGEPQRDTPMEQLLRY